MGQGIRSLRCLALSLALIAPSLQAMAQQVSKLQLTAVEPKTGTTTPGSKVRVYGQDFSTDAVVYFGGLEVREVKFVDPSTLEVVTPYLRPGSYQLQLKSGEITVRSDVTFSVIPSAVDSEIDRAIALAAQGQRDAAISLLTSVSDTYGDPQVRAFAHHQIGQIYFAQGDLWRWGGEAAAVFDPEAGRAVQTSWQYGLSYDKSTYLLPIESDADTPLKLADWTVQYDVTQDPEPRFFRGLVNARFGNLTTAEADCDFILSQEPTNSSYRALAAFIAVLNGHKTALQSFSDEMINDGRALSLLGEAAYLSGDLAGAQSWWAMEATAYPLGASLAYLAGKKHFVRGQRRVAMALLTECTVMAPAGKEAKEAEQLLVELHLHRMDEK
jgi:tetratricopeptide (TPR) repeat protein